MIHRCTRTLALGWALLAANGCVAWRRQDVTPKQLIQEKNPSVVQVTRSDHSKVQLYQPRIVGDTLTGHPSDLAIQRLAIPLNDISAIATRYRHIGKSLLAGLLILGGVAVYGLLQSLNTQ